MLPISASKFAALLIASLAITQVTASPVALAKEEFINSALADAEALGVDVNGPIPNDYTKYDPAEGRYEFAEGTKAAAWVRGQIAISERPDLDKRQGTSIGIGMWGGDWCTGGGVYWNDVIYNVAYVTPDLMYSTGISRRGLRANEHLDYSRSNGKGDLCGIYDHSAKPPVGVGSCWNTFVINCFRLWI
ncbi:hypothetical protein DFH27DRAFT_523956 [Peziza echinospora]|nr:hypothetical protein DFH27DRAFT_523956 [Peziza echinospora]